MKEKYRVNSFLDAETKEKLRRLAEEEQRSLSSQVSHLIRLYLRDYETRNGPLGEKETFTER